MKKEYIIPAIISRDIHPTSFMAASQQKIESGGSNKQTGAPTTAESKFLEFCNEEY